MGWEHGGRRTPEGLRLQEHEWFSHAACKGVSTDVFFDRGQPLALAYCRRCTVRTECADYAWENGIEYGVYGGVSANERAAGMRYMPEVPQVDDSSPTALEILRLHRSGMKWRAITRATGVHARTIFKLVQRERAS